MGARRVLLAVLVSASMCALSMGVGVASASASTSFGSYGEGPGQLEFPAGVAADATGDVYVVDPENHRVDKFDASGRFLLAWGEGVINGADELQTCTTSCVRGLESTQIAGGFGEPAGIAVDGSGDVYVVDDNNERVEKFDSSGKFILMYGGHVNAEASPTNPDLCVAGEKCKGGKGGTGDGEFSGWPFASFIATGPGDRVYVGDKARVQVFEPTGVWRENISLASLSATGDPTALAVDAAGDVYVKDQGVPGVRELEPGGIEKAFAFDSGSTSVRSLAVDSSGNVYVGDTTGGFHVQEYGSLGQEIASFGFGVVTGTNYGLAFSGTTGELYAPSEGAPSTTAVWALAAPAAGPLIVSELDTPELRGAVTFEGSLNAEGNTTEYHIEYVDQAHFAETGYASATSTPSASLPEAAFENQHVDAKLPQKTLVPGTTYHWRIVTKDSLGHTAVGEDHSFLETPSALIEGPWATDVAGTSATISARIDPLGAATEYRLEYGTDTSYGQTLRGNVGEGTSYVPIDYHRQDLQPGTTYHYRVVTVNEVGTAEGADHTFTTQPVSATQLTLPDGRAWELVSPANKHGAAIEPGYLSGNGLYQAASDGSGIAYLTLAPVVEYPAGKGLVSTVLSRRGPSGWTSQDLTLPVSPGEGQEGVDIYAIRLTEYPLFSPDLSSAVVQPPLVDSPLQSPETTERTLYLRNDTSGAFTALVTPNNVPAGTKFAGTEPPGSPQAYSTVNELFAEAATPDLNAVVLSSPYILTPNATSEAKCATCKIPPNLYEWSGGRLALVNVLPDGEATRAEEVNLVGGSGHLLGGQGSAPRAISNDGRRVAWTIDANAGKSGLAGALYVRDMVEGRTLRVGGPSASYQTMSADGSKIFFLENGELYEYEWQLGGISGTQVDLTAAHGAGESSAAVLPLVSNVSEDGSYVYFHARGVLAAGGVSGEDNLYVLHETGGTRSIAHVATLSGEDEKSRYGIGFGAVPALSTVSSRVSPDGRYLAFMSNRSLTGYDNTDAVSGEPDEEVYLYDAVADRLVCASCNPTGGRPVGVHDSYNTAAESLLIDRNHVWSASAEGGSVGNHWLAGSIPGWGPGASSEERLLRQPRYLSDNGRLFFDSPEALVPQDTNGLEDVYEYEPSGTGDCTTASLTFGKTSNGCVNLITSGTSSGESAFLDASENGDDAFFITASKLVGEDYDNSNDVYDAHVCSASAPCRDEAALPPPCTSGDSCKPAPSPQPEIFGAAPSATFSGTGNVLAPNRSVVKGRSLTRAQRFARALRTCRRKKTKRSRMACERQTKRRFGVARARKAKATGRGQR